MENTVETAVEILEIPNISEISLLPRDFKFRIKSATARMTQNKDVMFNLTCEFLFPEVVKLREGTFKIGGLEAPMMIVGSRKAVVSNKKFLKLFGLEELITFNEENMNNEAKMFEGLCFMAFKGSSKEPLQREVINDKGEVVRETVTDDSGKPIYTNKFLIWPSDVRYKIDSDQFAQQVF